MAARKFSMKKTIRADELSNSKRVLNLEMPIDIGARLDNIDAKLDDLTQLVRQNGELLKVLAPSKSLPSEMVAQNKPEYRPSSHSRSLRARFPDLEQLAFGRSEDVDEPEVQLNPRVDPNLGTL
jgi:hypothetical protein